MIPEIRRVVCSSQAAEVASLRSFHPIPFNPMSSWFSDVETYLRLSGFGYDLAFSQSAFAGLLPVLRIPFDVHIAPAVGDIRASHDGLG